MSLTYVSPKRPNRVYVRKFDHDDARRRYGAGESMSNLAQEYGVHSNAVRRVVSETYRESQARSRAQIVARGRCDRCEGPMNGLSRRRGSRLCISCTADDQATSAGDGELHCYACGEWKPDDAFPYCRVTTIRRRGRHTACRACQTRLKREYRSRNPEKSRAYDRAYKARRANALDNGAEQPLAAERTE